MARLFQKEELPHIATPSSHHPLQPTPHPSFPSSSHQAPSNSVPKVLARVRYAKWLLSSTRGWDSTSSISFMFSERTYSIVLTLSLYVRREEKRRGEIQTDRHTETEATLSKTFHTSNGPRTGYYNSTERLLIRSRLFSFSLSKAITKSKKTIFNT